LIAHAPAILEKHMQTCLFGAEKMATVARVLHRCSLARWKRSPTALILSLAPKHRSRKPNILCMRRDRLVRIQGTNHAQDVPMRAALERRTNKSCSSQLRAYGDECLCNTPQVTSSHFLGQLDSGIACTNFTVQAHQSASSFLLTLYLSESIVELEPRFLEY
jgi:hypothetical protein